jgi:anti-sigma B factor antagonist
MKFTQTTENDALILKLEGDLIGENSGVDLIEVVNDNIQKGLRYAIVDISKLRYMNSSGIGVLITIMTKFRNKGGEICLLNPSESVQKLLIITKLNAIFHIVANKEEAFEIFSKDAN